MKMFNKLFALSILMIVSLFSITTISAYTLKLPVCNQTINTSCINLNDAAGTSNSGTPAVVFYQNGNLYISNDIPMNYSNNYYVTNVTNVNLMNVTNITQQYTNITYLTYVMNYSNGSSFVYQPNYSIDNNYLKNLFQEVYVNSNFSNFYNKSYIDSTFETIGDINNVKNSLATFATRTELANYDARLSSLNNLNSMNWTGFNLTEVKDHIENGGDFSTTWKVVIIIESIIILLLLLFVVRSMMSGGDGGY